MSTILIEPTAFPTSLELPGSGECSYGQFLELCRKNPDSHIERDENGDINIMAPSGGETSRRNSQFVKALGNWADTNGGIVLESSGGFRLPNGAIRAPDSAWISQANWDSCPPEEREGFPNIVPEFVAEIVSPSDSLPKLIAKMQEYAANGVSLGWLLIPATREVQIYRPGIAEPEIHRNVTSLSADDSVLPGFLLDFSRIW